MDDEALERGLADALACWRDGRPEAAEELCRKLLALRPDNAAALCLLGRAHLNRRDWGAAAAALEKAVAIDPAAAEAHHLLGNALRAQGRSEAAESAYRQALARRPDYPEAHFDLGTIEVLRGRPRNAEASYRRAVALRPDYAAAHANLANVLVIEGRVPEAVASYRRALELDPNDADTWNNLGKILRRQGDLKGALESFRHAVASDRGDAGALNNLGSALREAGWLDEAVEQFERALALDPDNPEAHHNMGNALLAQGRLDAAMERYRRALALAPNDALTHYNFGLACLLAGDCATGWQEFEWRRRVWHQPRPGPQWRGEDPAGKTILLYAEEGYGNTIHFLRYVPLVARRGGRVVLVVQAPLVRLAASLPAPVAILAAGDPLPGFDVCCPLPSLPGAFGTTLETIPADIPYLSADPAEREGWRRSIPPGARLRVGLAWAANPNRPGDRQRSLTLERLRPLFALSGIEWFSLQTGPPAAEIARLPAGSIIDLSPWLDDFGQTAAAIANLDFVLSVDTAVAHLAGALGRPVWVMLAFAADWRWLRERDDSPWYPTMRLFRQGRPGDWEGVVARIAESFARISRPSPGP